MGWKLNRLRARGRKQSRRSRGIRYRFQPRRRRRGATCLHIRVALWKIRTGHIWLTDLPHRGLIMFRYMVRIPRRSPSQESIVPDSGRLSNSLTSFSVIFPWMQLRGTSSV